MICQTPHCLSVDPAILLGILPWPCIAKGIWVQSWHFCHDAHSQKHAFVSTPQLPLQENFSQVMLVVFQDCPWPVFSTQGHWDFPHHHVWKLAPLPETHFTHFHAYNSWTLPFFPISKLQMTKLPVWQAEKPFCSRLLKNLAFCVTWLSTGKSHIAPVLSTTIFFCVLFPSPKVVCRCPAICLPRTKLRLYDCSTNSYLEISLHYQFTFVFTRSSSSKL